MNARTGAKDPLQTKNGTNQKSKRLSPEDRRNDFIEKAIVFFADEGFDSSTHRLAQHLGVTQPLLYRYFPSKEDLIAAVYDRVYVNRWQNEWSGLLSDRTRSMRDRLHEFYGLYTDAIFERDWMRIYLFAGLRGVGINRRYMDMVRDRILEPIISEAHNEFGVTARPASEREIEFAWALHGGIFYFGIRKLIYENCEDSDLAQVIEDDVAALLYGLKRIAGKPVDPA